MADRSWRVDKHGTNVVVAFHGRLDGESGRRSAEAFRSLLLGRAHDVVWDLRAMDGYDADARTAWQRILWPERHLLRSVTVVGGSAPVRVGASLLTMLLGCPCRFVDELPAESQAG